MASFSDENKKTIGSNAPIGPLSDLYSNEYDFENLFYPRNLASQTRGHYINFYINVADATSMTKNVDGTDYSFATDAQGQTISGRTGVNSAQTAIGKSVAAPVVIRRTKRIKQAIALYMPETVNVQYNASWQSDSLTDALGNVGLTADVVKTIENAIANKTTSGLTPLIAEGVASLGEGTKLLGTGARNFALFAAGYALNPRLEVLFKGTDMRQFQFDFLFSPFNSAESQNVEKIIKTFRYHQAPEINTNDYGRLFVPPSEFDIDFLKDGQINDKIHQIGSCVLTGVNVDYSPFGWSTFEDGYPTNIKLSLNFMETEIVTKQRVAEDNY